MILVMDVGGTKIKYGAARDDGTLLPETVEQADSHADESADAVLSALRQIIRGAQAKYAPKRACVCMPGPFDYVLGVSHMRHKFASIEGVSLKGVFEDAGLRVDFVHDSTAFILGERSAEKMRDAETACCVMLGTGLGFAMLRGGYVLEKVDHRPAFTLWNAPYLDGICEDYVSTRAIQKHYGEPLPVKTIADAARGCDRRASDSFLRVGEHLGAILGLVQARFHPDLCALGGQISAAADLMDIHSPIPLYQVSSPALTALRGAAVYASLGRENTVEEVGADLPFSID
ncbi:MAG: ROK family protein [Clostridia bacterium]|nr:ROK family protein [Clostridia bacterium]